MTTLNLKPFETLIHKLWQLEPEIEVKEEPAPVHPEAVWFLNVVYRDRKVVVQWQQGSYRLVWQAVGGVDVVLHTAVEAAELIFNRFKQPLDKLEGPSAEDDAEGDYSDEPEIDPEEQEAKWRVGRDKHYTSVGRASASLTHELLSEAFGALEERRWHDLNQAIDGIHPALDVFKGMTVDGMDEGLVYLIQFQILRLLNRLVLTAGRALKKKDWTLFDKSLEHVNALKMAVRSLDDL
jgi:hypothetical protein